MSAKSMAGHNAPASYTLYTSGFDAIVLTSGSYLIRFIFFNSAARAAAFERPLQYPVIAKGAKRTVAIQLDCFVASLLAMTRLGCDIVKTALASSGRGDWK